MTLLRRLWTSLVGWLFKPTPAPWVDPPALQRAEKALREGRAFGRTYHPRRGTA